MLLLLDLPAAVHGKNMKFSRTLSFNDNLGDALKDLVGDLKNSEKANKEGGQCTFKCENGERATKRANHFPVADGCMVRAGKRRSIEDTFLHAVGIDREKRKKAKCSTVKFKSLQHTPLRETQWQQPSTYVRAVVQKLSLSGCARRDARG